MKKKKPESTETEHQLPDFLGMAAKTDTVESDAVAEVESVTSGEGESAAAEVHHEAHEADDGSIDAEAPLVVDTPADSAADASTRGATKRRGGGAGNKSLLLGVVLGVGALALAAMPAADVVLPQLSRFGIEPQTLLILGAILFASGVTRRRVGALVQRIDDVESQDRDWTQSARESLHFLVEAQHASNERPPAAGEELQHVLVALQRQDDKLGNLTKAVKMYGKPLMEISSHGAELGGSLSQVKAAIDATATANRAAFAQIESRVQANGTAKELNALLEVAEKIDSRVQANGTTKELNALLELAQKIDSRVQANGTPTKQLNELLEVVQKIDEAITTLRNKSHAPSLDPLQQQVGRLEVGVAAIGQRLEDSEVRKSLLRLEEAAQQTNTELNKVRGDGLQKATAHIEERLDKATGRLSEGIQQMRQTNLAGLEGTVRDLQRELSGVATAVAQIQAAVRSGARPAAVAPAASAAPVAASVATSIATAQPAPAAPAHAPAAAAGDNNGYQTGTRSTSGKNVLGAIAKLKQMKT